MAAAKKDSSYWLMYVLMGVLVLANTVPYAMNQWRRGGWSAISLRVILLGVAPLLLMIVFVPLAAKWAARRQLRTGPTTQGVQRIGVGDWGLAISGPLYNGEIAWSSMMRANETPEFFLFFISKLQAFFIPKRLLSEADTVRVRELVGAGLGNKAELLVPR
jgi:hypothetical protein